MSTQPSDPTSYLPQHPGLLPKWLLFISLVSLANSIQSYASLAGTREVYAGNLATTPKNPSGTGDGSNAHPSAAPSTAPPKTNPSATTSPVTPLSARTFGTWTTITALVRLYAAYHIDNGPVYELALWSFVVAGGHFYTEWLVYGTARWGRGLLGPLCVATGTGAWMVLQWGSYVKA